MKVVLKPINHDNEDGFEEFIAGQLADAERVTVEFDGMFFYAEIEEVSP